ncbi:phosphoglycerate mutase [Luteimonas aquatica]|uniref:phosphoglycerate mutase n=1 Tax=Luteimonas aquatica TaxID=450364 RepID=UPI001F586E30|nr:phosphoglycerate mutase [Luteimonas aquatica]
MSRATFLLPSAARFGAQRLSAACDAALGRGDRLPPQSPGRRAQLLRHFALPEGQWPIAALSRQADAGDAEGAAWLRADPVWLRPDINGVRLMAHGEALQATQADCEALLPALKPVFGDAGFALDAPLPARWYLRLPREARIPAFADPAEALGDDLFEHMDAGAEARRWRALENEAQIVLHNHPWNAQRAARGLPPINALWFWGGGTLPAAGVRMPSPHAGMFSDDATAQALAAGTSQVAALPARYPGGEGDLLFDLTQTRDLAWVEHEWLQPALAALRRGAIGRLELDDEAGRVLRLDRWHRLRFWRGPSSRARA